LLERFSLCLTSPQHPALQCKITSSRATSPRFAEFCMLPIFALATLNLHKSIFSPFFIREGFVSSKLRPPKRAHMWSLHLFVRLRFMRASGVRCAVRSIPCTFFFSAISQASIPVVQQPTTTACSNHSIHSNPLTLRWLHTFRPTLFTAEMPLSTRLKTGILTYRDHHLHLVRILLSAGRQPPLLIMAGEFQRSAHPVHNTSQAPQCFLFLLYSFVPLLLLLFLCRSLTVFCAPINMHSLFPSAPL
jgi:hypothetical protein